MLKFLKIIFTWWNGQTIGTFLNTLFFGKLVGIDDSKNKYYVDSKDRRYGWQKDHQENKTGTDEAYNPNKYKPQTKSDYESWRP